MEIEQQLFLMQDMPYKHFQEKLIPNIPNECIIGVRTPALRKMAKEMTASGEADGFLRQLPHRYFEENQLHAFLLSEEREEARLFAELERFLPHIDNWATCDQLSPKHFKRHRARLDKEIGRWLSDPHPYTVRFAIGMRMKHFLGEDYRAEYLEQIAAIHREEYYVRMMVAWFFATALCAHEEQVMAILESGRLDPFTHNKTIVKAIESFRITDTRKQALRKLYR